MSRTKSSVFIGESKINRLLRDSKFIVDLYYAFQTDDELFLVMDLCVGGTLFYFLNQLEPGIKNRHAAKFYLAEVITALEFIHSKNVIYRDLKPENILIDIDGHIKVSDFGLAKCLSHKDQLRNTFGGSPEYLAPEMLTDGKHSRTIDFYTLGGLIYELLIGIPPFYSEDRQQMAYDILHGELWFPFSLADDAKDLMKLLLNKDQSKRPGEFSEVKNHKFFEDIHWGKFLKKQVIPPWIPDLYSWHYNPKFLSIPLEEALDEKYIPENIKARGSFYLELLPNSSVMDKISVYGFNRNSSLMSNERTIDPIKKTDEDDMYLEGFDYESHPKEELIIKDQLNAYQEVVRMSIYNKKCEILSESDNEIAEPDMQDTFDNCGKNSVMGYKLKPFIISGRDFKHPI